jgi:Periplasmic binding protein
LSLRLVLALALACGGCEDVLGIDTNRYLVDGGGAKSCSGTLGVRILYDMTGPTSDVSVDDGKGVYDLLRDLDANGGIRGCALDLDVADTKYDVPTTLAAYQAWKARPDWAGVSTIIAGGTPMIQALGPLVAEDGRLLVSGAYAGELASPLAVSHDIQVPSLNGSFASAVVPTTKASPGYPEVFFPATDYTTSARIGMSYAWRQAAKRVGFFYCSTSAFCTEPVDGAKTFLQELGSTQIGRDLDVELDDADAVVAQKVMAFFQEEQAEKATDPGYTVVDWVWFGNTRTSLASLGKALQAVQAQLGVSVTVIADTYALDEALYSACGAACSGFLGVQPLPTYGDPSILDMAELVQVHDRWRANDGEGAGLYATAEYVGGYVTADMWRIMVEGVVDGGMTVTGANLRSEAEGFQNLNVDGFGTVSFSASDHRPNGSASIYRLTASGLQAVGQPIAIPLQPDWLGW